MKTVSCLFVFWVTVFLSGCAKEKIKVGIQPFENFNSSLTDTVVRAIEKTYEAEVYLLKATKLPRQAFVQSKVSRYRADSLLLFLERDKSNVVDYKIGLTHQDISFTKKEKDGSIKKPERTYSDWGVFGLGYMPGNSCIVSTYRLQHPNTMVFISRLKKVAIHELGHNLGLPHCSTKGCVMQDAVESIQTIDSSNATLCKACQSLIH